MEPIQTPTLNIPKVDDGTTLPQGVEGPLNKPEYESENPQVTNQQTNNKNPKIINTRRLNRINRKANREERRNNRRR